MAVVASTWPIGTAGALTGPARTRRNLAGAGAAAPASSTVPHAWHSPHRPAHLVVCQPHSVHRNALAAAPADDFVMTER
jgi:hypothetical protein